MQDSAETREPDPQARDGSGSEDAIMTMTEAAVTARGTAGPRILAWLVDWLCILGWVAVVAAVGVPLYLVGATRSLSFSALNVVATVTLVLPVTVAMALLESGARQGTFGKRRLRLRVVDSRTGARVPFPRTLLRNVLKTALPWTIGHAAVYGLVGTGASEEVGASVIVLTALAYAIPIAYLVSLFVAGGRTLYDRLAGTTVTSLSSGRQ